MLHRIKKQKIHKNKIMEVKMKHDLFGSILFLALLQKIDMGNSLRVPFDTSSSLSGSY